MRSKSRPAQQKSTGPSPNRIRVESRLGWVTRQGRADPGQMKQLKRYVSSPTKPPKVKFTHFSFFSFLSLKTFFSLLSQMLSLILQRI